MAMAFPSSRTETSSFSYSSLMIQSSSSSSSSTANVKLHRHSNKPPSPPPQSSTSRFSVEQQTESMTKDSRNNNAVSEKRRCMCSPTSHAGSFRCAYHKRMAEQEQQRKQKQLQKQQEVEQQQQQQQRQQITAWSRSKTLNLRRSAMKNSLVRIGVEGEIVKRTLTNLIRPSLNHLRRREVFQPKPSRLSVMSKVQEHSYNSEY